MSIRTATELINLSLNIRRFREDKGWSQSELAEKLGISRESKAAISRWEHPIPDMSIRSLEKLADIFDVPIKRLFEDS